MRRWDPDITPGKYLIDYGLEDDLQLVTDDERRENVRPGYPMWYCKNGNLLKNFELKAGETRVTFLFHRMLEPAEEKKRLMVVGPDWRIENILLEPSYPDNGDEGTVTFSVRPSAETRTYRLFRTLSFSQDLTDVQSGTSIGNNTERLVLVIHGWNEGNLTNKFTDEKWPRLTNAFARHLPTNWSLVLYDWSVDAATGTKCLDPNSGPDAAYRVGAALNGAEAAEIGHSHGRHLGELLRQKAPNLKRVHFIAHSAGSWVARTAATYLLQNPPNPDQPVQIQVTLLDPFMPVESGFQDSLLGKVIMGRLAYENPLSARALGPTGPPWSVERLFKLENYYAFDISGPGTRQEFAWRPDDIHEHVDLGRLDVYVENRYGDHGGPIEFYADSIEGKIPWSYLSKLGDKGWPQSMAYAEKYAMSVPWLSRNKNSSVGSEVVTIQAGGHAEVHFTRDGSDPKRESELYTGPFPLDRTTTITARAFPSSQAIGLFPSDPVKETYTILPASALGAPDFYPPEGSYAAPQPVRITASPPDAIIRYTMDGSEPGVNSLLLPNGGTLRLTESTVVTAKAFKDGVASSVTRAAFTLIGAGTKPQISVVNSGQPVTGRPERQWITIEGAGFMKGFAAVFTDETNRESWPTITDPNRLEFVNGTVVRVKAGVGVETALWSVLVVNPNGSPSEKAYFSVVPSVAPLPLATPTFSHGSGTYTAPITVELATTTANAIIRFTSDGSDPTEGSQLYTSPIPISRSTSLKARAFKYGVSPSAIATVSYTIALPQSGGVSVTLGPQEAVTAGAQWRANGGAWRATGEIADGVSLGNAVLEFKKAPGWIPPPPRVVTVMNGIITRDSAAYQAENRPPNAPANPTPVNGAANVDRHQVTLAWTGGDAEGTVQYAIRLGTDPNPGFYAGFGAVPGNSYQVPAALQGGTTYYWGVRALDKDGATTDGPVWTFTTGYAYADLVARDLAVTGVPAPRGQVTLSITVKNEGAFAAPGAYVHFYLSRSRGGKELRLTPNVPEFVYPLEPGQEKRVSFVATLDMLQGGRSYIDAWIDSGPPGPYNEQNFANNTASLGINYTDTNPPEITWLILGGGQTYFKTGNKYGIVYAARDDVAVTALDLYWSIDGGLSWQAIVQRLAPEAPYGGSYAWQIPADFPLTQNLKIRLVAHDASGNSSETIAGPYTTRSGLAPTVRVVSPNGGEVWDMGSSQTIRWTASLANGVEGVVLDLEHDGTISPITTFLGSDPGSYVWQVPSPLRTLTGRIRVRVVDLNDNYASDTSDGFFTVRDNSVPPPAPWAVPGAIPSSSAGDSGGMPRIAADPAGAVHLIYGLEHNPSAKTVSFRYRKLVGASWGAPVVVRLDTTDQDATTGANYLTDEGSIAADMQGRPHVVWLADYGSPSERNKKDVFYTFFDGSQWAAPVNVSRGISGDYMVNSFAWTQKANLPRAQAHAAAAVAGGKVYVLGGSSRLKNFEFNPTANLWTPKADVPGNGVDEGGAVEVGGKIYAVGNLFESAIKIYDPAGDSWTQGATMPTARRGFVMVAVGGRIYTIGDFGANKQRTEMYDPASNRWEQKRDMPTGRGFAAGAAVAGKIYVIGGAGEGGSFPQTIDVYDPATDTWDTRTGPPAANWPRCQSSAAIALNGRIYLLGGALHGDDMRSVSEYDPQANSWTPMNPMQVARRGACSGVIGGKIYVVGGSDGTGELSSVEEATVSSHVVGTASESPRIAIDTTGRAHVVWRDGTWWRPDGDSPLGYSSAGQFNLYHCVVTGGTPSVPVRVTEGYTGRGALVADGRGNVHLVFGTAAASNAYMKWDGSSWSTAVVATSPSSQGNIDLFVDGTGRQHMLWDYWDALVNSRRLYYSFRDSTSWSPPETIALSSAGVVGSVAADSFGRAHVVWEVQGVPTRLLYSRRIAEQWTAPIQLHKNSESPAQFSGDSTIGLGMDELHVVWASGGEVFYNHANVASTVDAYPPSVSVTTPQGGQILSVGTLFEVQWSAVDGIGVVSIDVDYTADGGFTWVPIKVGLPNQSTLSWLVPDLGANTGQIRVTARDAAGNIGAGFSGRFTTADLSPPTVRLLRPEPGSALVGGSTTSLEWTATDNVGVKSVDLGYSLDGGASWFELANGVPESGVFPWTVPNGATSALLLRAVARDGVGLASTDVSSAPLKIVRANSPPLVPNSPFPLLGAVNQPVGLTALTWSGLDPDGDGLEYQVRFGKAATPPVVYSGPASTFNPGALERDTTYYWQVVATDTKATTASPLWSFKTEAKITPSLSWQYPGDIVAGTPLSGTELSARANVPGQCLYNPALGTVLPGGAGRVLRVDFVPDDSATYTTATATVTINVLGVAPTLTVPSSQTIGEGADVSFAVTADGSAPMRYQWQRNGVIMANGGRISGATGRVLGIRAAETADAGNYTVVVANDYGAVTSQVAVLTVLENLVLPANGGRLESFTSQYDDSGWAAARLTDGVRQGVGGSWASRAGPGGPQTFVYSFREQRAVRMGWVVLYNFSEASRDYFSKAVAFYGSMDGATWSLLNTGELAATEGPQRFELGGVKAGYLKVVVASGYSMGYWELGEVEAYGVIMPAATINLEGMSQTYDGSPKPVTVTTIPPGLAVAVTYDGSGSVPVNAGSYVVKAIVNDANYAGSAEGTLVISPAAQTVNFGPLGVVGQGDAPFALTGTASSGLPVAYTSSNPQVATVSGSTVTIVGPGSTTITAVQEGGGNYQAAPELSQTLIVLENLVLATNGGKLESFTGQYNDSSWAASRLNDGVRQGPGGSWASPPFPTSPHAFVYSFRHHQAARMDYALICNFGESEDAYSSQGIEFHVSNDGIHWTWLTNGVLAQVEGPQRFELGATTSRFVKVVVTSGYARTYWELGEIEVYGAVVPDTNVLLPANGGQLLSSTSQYNDSTWAAARLTDGVKQGPGGSWASTAYPAEPQQFVYSFADRQAARLDYAVVHNFGESGGAYASREVQFLASWDGRNWTMIGGGVLAATEGPQSFELGGASGLYVKVLVTSGYARSYWELGEIEVYGALLGGNLVLPANGGQLLSFTGEYDDTVWSAARLTDGSRQGIGGSWASKAFPAGPQEFVYGFANQHAARLDHLVLYNFGESGGAYASRGIECYVSWDREHWGLAGSGVLAPSEGPQVVELGGARGLYVKVVVTSGYAQTYWELGEIEVYGSLLGGNLVGPANGGQLLSFTTEYDDATWSASRLTDGRREGIGSSWASKAFPGTPQEFVYSFTNQQPARLDYLVLYNFGESGGAYASRGIECYVSWDRTRWALIGRRTLAPSTGAQVVELGGARGVYVKVVVTGGYAQTYWELGEIEVYGSLLGGSLLSPANGGTLESLTSQYPLAAWAAGNLTDGVKDCVGFGWASAPYPSGPQKFVYSFLDQQLARLDWAVIHNLSEGAGAYYSKDVEVWSSFDGANWTRIASGVLEARSGAQWFDLRGRPARKVKVVVTSGYAREYWELGEIEVYGALTTQNLLSPANGAALESFTAQYDGRTWAATNLTDGVREGSGSAWASPSWPVSPQEFVFSLRNQELARLDWAVLYNFTEAGGNYWSKGVEFYTSLDGANWSRIASGELAAVTGPQWFDLRGVPARKLKVVVSGGYAPTYWELGEVEVYGAWQPDNVILPAKGGHLESFTAQFNDTSWAAARLTDGVKQGLGGSWASMAFPKEPQEFVYSFANQHAARLNYAVVYNFGESGGDYASRGVEFYGSLEGAHWVLLTTAVLAQAEGPQMFDLGGALASYLKVVVTGGYAGSYWELGEVEAYGVLQVGSR